MNLPSYTYIHQVQKGCKRGSVRICAHNSLVVTKKENLSMNCDDLETLVIETDNAKDKSVIVNLFYRPPKWSLITFHEYLTLFLDRAAMSNKNIVLIGDFNLILLKSYQSHSVKI